MLHSTRTQLIHDCCLQTALGLQHMHTHCVLHRDIKSLNLLLTADLQIKIGDLGIATVCSFIP